MIRRNLEIGDVKLDLMTGEWSVDGINPECGSVEGDFRTLEPQVPKIQVPQGIEPISRQDSAQSAALTRGFQALVQ